MNEIELIDIADDLLIINKTTIEKLFSEKNQNALILYLFYYKTAKWQKHNPIKANDTYCKKSLHWGTDKLQATKKILNELELIQTENRKNSKGQIEGWYIRINYYTEKSRIPETTIPDSPLVVKQETNTINNININTNNNINTKEYFENEETNNLFIEFLELRKKLKAVNSDRAIDMLIKKLNEHDDNTKQKMIEQSILNSWKGIFPIREKTAYKTKTEKFYDLLKQYEEE